MRASTSSPATRPWKWCTAAEGHTGGPVAWISDRTRPFVIVLLESEVTHHLGGWSHLGVGLASRELVDTTVAAAQANGLDTFGPHNDGPPVGYWAIIVGPDGHQLELSYGQEVNVAVTSPEPPGSVPD